MSKILAPIPTVFAAFVLILQFFTISGAQEADIRIRIKADKPTQADVRVNFGQIDTPVAMSFLSEYGSETGLLPGRLSTVFFYDNFGFLIATRDFTPDLPLMVRNFAEIGYIVDLSPRKSAFAAAHISWAKADGGLIMLDDLLPQSMLKAAKVRFELPAGWKVVTTESETVPFSFKVANAEKAVFHIGSNLREQAVKAGNSTVKIVVSGEWLFADVDAAEMTRSIVGEYEKAFGNLGKGDLSVRLMRFPEAVSMGNWEADTRGRSVTIVSSDMPFKNQSQQRLHEQLRHELFHLWIPNNVNLSGNYDWFYEGFALYQSLKVGVGVNRLRFEDFLDTLSRAYAIDASQTNRTSLIDASKTRWNGSNTTVYARGMLLAFLSDIAMLDASGGKRSVTDLIKEVVSKHSLSTPRIDGNTALMTLFRSYPELVAMTERYISGSDALNMDEALMKAGIEIDRTSGTPRFRSIAKPSGKQKKILEKLGIDNWKKN